jgi:hypothetical protein
MRNRAWWYVGAMIVIAPGRRGRLRTSLAKGTLEYKCVFASNVQSKRKWKNRLAMISEPRHGNWWPSIGKTLMETLWVGQPTISNVPDRRNCSFRANSNVNCVHIVEMCYNPHRRLRRISWRAAQSRNMRGRCREETGGNETRNESLIRCSGSYSGC